MLMQRSEIDGEGEHERKNWEGQRHQERDTQDAEKKGQSGRQRKRVWSGTRPTELKRSRLGKHPPGVGMGDPGGPHLAGAGRPLSPSP